MDRIAKLKQDVIYALDKTLADAVTKHEKGNPYTSHYLAGMITPEEYLDLVAPEILK